MNRRSFLKGLLAAPAAVGFTKLAIVVGMEKATERQVSKVIRHCNNYAIGPRNMTYRRGLIPNEFIERDALFRKYLLEVAQEEGWV